MTELKRAIIQQLFQEYYIENATDILLLCSDGLTGLKEAISAAFPKAEHQRCIVHMVRNTCT